METTARLSVNGGEEADEEHSERADTKISLSSVDEHHCACGNPGHINLRKWYESEYRYPSTVEQVVCGVEDDEINLEEIETAVQNTILHIEISSNGLCVRCLTFFSTFTGEPEDHPKKPYYHTTLEWNAGCIKGCRLCLLLKESLRQYSYWVVTMADFYKVEKRLRCLEIDAFIYVSLFRKFSGANIELRLHFPDADASIGSQLIHCGIHCIPNHQLGLFATGDDAKPLKLPQDSEQVGLVKQWMKGCLTTHDHSRAQFLGGPIHGSFPGRLVAVNLTPIRVVETKHWDWKSRPKYATLSHCWGIKEFLTLTTSSLEAFLVSLPVDRLTKVFQDAIKFTRELDLDYLWIDSLCIIQDSPQDKSNEIPAMSSIFGNSTITLAATGAYDGTDGLHIQDPNFMGRVTIPPDNSNDLTQWEVCVEVYQRSVTNGPLAKRAWALQERILSPRTVHFTITELFWECKCLLASASFPESFPESLVICNIFNTHLRRNASLRDNWGSIVQHYTSAQLSYPDEDKFKAISGLARKAAEESGDQYKAGLWKRNIELQLCWISDDPLQTKHRAPSWSWVSTNNDVFSYYNSESAPNDIEYYARAASIKIIPLSDDKFGAVKSGELRLTCLCLIPGSSSLRWPICVRNNITPGTMVLPLFSCSLHGSHCLESLVLVLKNGKYYRVTQFSVSSYEDEYQAIFKAVKELASRSEKTVISIW